jgi:signal transduction histidine kinase
MRRRLTATLRRLPIRLKLTLVFTGVMALVLAAVGGFLYLHFRSGLDSSLNQQLRARANELASVVSSARSGTRAQQPLHGSSENFAQILGDHRQVLAFSVGFERPLLSGSEAARAKRGALFIARDERTRLFAIPAGHGRSIVVVGVSLAQHERALETLGAALLIGGPLALVVASLAAYGFAIAALRPVESMRRRAAVISSGDVGARLPLPESVDEIYRLGSTLNEMLARLEAGFEHERGFVADASHELRMPLTVLKAELEVSLREHQTPSPLREVLVSAAEETDRIIALAEDLLVLATADRGRLPLDLRTVSVPEVLETVKARYSHAASRAERTLIVATDGTGVLRADPARIEQAVANLVENALRYGHGIISLTARASGERVEIHVTDEGAGFPADFLAVAFERFSRADRARGRGGTGLGLAIVDAIAHAHGGEAHATNRPDGGADVWLTLPGLDTEG